MLNGNFKTDKLGSLFKIHFESGFDFERVRLMEWTWYKKHVMLVLSWTRAMDPSEDLYDTLPIWVKFPNIKSIY